MFLMLQEDYVFYNLDGKPVTIPKGFIFDGASIPDVAKYFLGTTPISSDILVPGLIHDYMYRYGEPTSYNGMTNKEYADMMIAVNAAILDNKDWLEIWAGLYAGGFVAYGDHESRRNNGEYDSFINMMGGNDYYEENIRRYNELNPRWTGGQLSNREGPTVIKDIWAELNAMGLLKRCLGEEYWTFPVDKVVVGSGVYEFFLMNSKDHYSTMELQKQPSLNYLDSFKNPQSDGSNDDITATLVAVNELFRAHLYQTCPWVAEIGTDGREKYRSISEGYSALMTWKYAKEHGIDDESAFFANRYGEVNVGSVKAIINAIRPEADISNMKKMMEVMDQITPREVQDYIHNLNATISSVEGRRRVRAYLADLEISEEAKESLTEVILSYVDKGADLVTALLYAKALGDKDFEDQQKYKEMIDQEMAKSQREKCRDCLLGEKNQQPDTGVSAGEENGNGQGGSGSGSGEGKDNSFDNGSSSDANESGGRGSGNGSEGGAGEGGGKTGSSSGEPGTGEMSPETGTPPDGAQTGDPGSGESSPGAGENSPPEADGGSIGGEPEIGGPTLPEIGAPNPLGHQRVLGIFAE